MPTHPIHNEPSLTLKHLELDTLLDITNAINRQHNEQSLLKIFLFTLVANFKIRKLLVCSRDVGGWSQVLKHGLESDYLPDKEILKEMERTFSITHFKNSHFQSFKSHFDVAIPVGRENRIIALVFIGGSRRINDEHGSESIKFVQTISNIILVAIQNIRLNQRRLEQQAIKKEIELARKLQSQLFPQRLPDNERLQITASYIPQLVVGGDYYDYIKLSEDEFIVCIADVSGKGVPAAFIMSNIQSALRILAKQWLRLEEIIKELNTLVHDNTKGEMFVTFFIAKYMLHKDKLVYINCGHNAPLLYRSNGQFESLDKGTLILGAFEALPIVETGKVEDIANSVLFAYTDGLVESFEKTDTDIGVEIIKNIIASNKNRGKLNTEILDKMDIKNAAMDDITMLSCFLK